MINRGCDKFYIGPQDFNDAVEAMIKAGPDGYGAEWDIADAFKALYFHVSCVDLTQFHIPGLGYAYQASGIFGAATCGYRWHICGGRLLSTLYHVMSFRCKYDTVKDFVATRAPFPCVRPSNADILQDPTSFTSFGVWGNQEVMIHARGLAKLQALDPVTPLATARNTDDFFHASASAEAVVGTTKTSAFLHRRYLLRLKASKCLYSKVPKYDGVLFDFLRQLLAIPPDKITRSQAELTAILGAALVSISMIDRAKGLLMWYAKVFPEITAFLRSACMWVVKHRAIAKSRKLSEDLRTFSIDPILRSDLIMVQSFLASGIRSRSVSLRSVPRSIRLIQVVVHFDWAAHCQAGVILDSGEYFVHTPGEKQMQALSKFDSQLGRNVLNSPGFEGATLPVLLATFRPILAGRVALILSDSLSFVQAFYNMKSASPFLSEAVKVSMAACLHLNCYIILEHISSEGNFADPASRGDMSGFRSRCIDNNVPLHSRPTPSVLPDATWLPTESLLF